MSKAPTFPFYASDFLTSTSEFDADTVGVYIRLLATQWVNNDLPNDIKRLAKIGGVSFERMNVIWKEIGTKFISNSEGRLVNPRLENIRQAKSEFIEKAKEFGKAGAEKRWNNPENRIPHSLPYNEPYRVDHQNPNGVDMAFLFSISNIIKYLNSRARKEFKEDSKASKKHIMARLKEGFTEDDFKKVIDTKVNNWINDPKMNLYLRPETLFGNKFESYLNETVEIQITPQKKMIL